MKRLELVNQTQRYDIISTDTRLTGEFIFINQVDFVINVGGHVFVEVVSRANINIFQQILVAVAVFQVLTFRLQVRHGWTQTEVELILRIFFTKTNINAIKRASTHIVIIFDKPHKTRYCQICRFKLQFIKSSQD